MSLRNFASAAYASRLRCRPDGPKQLVRRRVGGEADEEHRPRRPSLEPARWAVPDWLNAFRHIPQGTGRFGTGIARGREAVELENRAGDRGASPSSESRNDVVLDSADLPRPRTSSNLCSFCAADGLEEGPLRTRREQRSSLTAAEGHRPRDLPPPGTEG
jgi:hypothetical protein